MKKILITGADGSGKSYLLDRLKSSACAINIVRAPFLDVSVLDPSTKEFKVAAFLNTINNSSDTQDLPQLKALALFGSMLLMKHYENIYRIRNSPYLIFERHPLVDAIVYSKFYVPKLNPALLKAEDFESIDEKYSEELDHLISLLPCGENTVNNSKALDIVQFIYNWFHVKNRNSQADLQALFGIDMVEKIFYLKASPELLYERIRKRERLEAHESLQTISLLTKAYDSIFDQLKSLCTMVEIDASDFAKLDDFYHGLRREFGN